MRPCAVLTVVVPWFNEQRGSAAAVGVRDMGTKVSD